MSSKCFDAFKFEFNDGCISIIMSFFEKQNVLVPMVINFVLFQTKIIIKDLISIAVSALSS